MNGKYHHGQTVYLSGARDDLVKEAEVIKYTGGFYTIKFPNGGGTRVKEHRLFPIKKEAVVIKR